MLRNALQRSRLGLWVLFIAVLIVLPASIIMGQGAVPVAPSTAVVGNIAADGQTITYSFTGNAGDLVTIRAVGITAGMNPNLTLLGPAGQQLAANEDEPFMAPSTAAQIVARLTQSGAHSAVVGGTAGDFVLTLDVRPPVIVTTLELDTPVDVTLPMVEPAQVFVFNTVPDLATTLFIEIAPSDANVHVDVRGATGQLAALLQGNVDNACVSFAPGDELHEVTIVATAEASSTVTITLSNAPCELGEVPVEVTPRPTAVFTPVAIEGACAASAPRTVNIRSGPSTDFGVVALLPAGQPIQVVGQNEDGTWFAVQSEFVTGWVSARVVQVTGPCENLPVMPLPTAPPASPTPGLPVMTATPEATEEETPEQTPEETGTAEPTAEVTETPGGGMSFTTTLSGAAEPSGGDPDGTGTATVTVNTQTNEVCYEISVANIVLPATAAHVHIGAVGVDGPPVIGLNAPDASGAASGCLSADATLVADIAANPSNYYVNVHTSDFPDGAVRGQLG